MGYVGYVFVDESGNHTDDDCYVVAGWCCASRYDEPTRVLRSVRDRVAENVLYRDGNASRELKGTRASDRRLDSTFAYLRNVFDEGSGSDPSIDAGRVGWTRDAPVRVSLHDTSSATARHVLENHVATERSHRPVQVLSLVSVLNPLLWYEFDERTRIDEYRVILDAPSWKAATRTTKAAIDSLDWTPEVRFRFEDSRAIPGIQLADVAAYSRRRFLKSGACERAQKVLDALSF